MQFAYGLGPLMVLKLTGSSSLAGLSVAIIGLSRFIIAYPIGRITDVFGRKPGILMGLAIALIGTIVVGLGMMRSDAVMFSVGLLIFAMGMNAAQQLRVAATDMFPPTYRAQALGFIALGSLTGLVISPLMIATGDYLGKAWNTEGLALPWLMLPGLIIPGMILVLYVRPDPKHIGMNLASYYPGYKPPEHRAENLEAFSPMTLLRQRRSRNAIFSNCAAQGNMAIVMVLTSLVLHDHGHSLSAIGFSHMFHTAGMFAFTIPLGRLADRIGREQVMYPGVVTALIGAIMVTFTPDYYLITIGTFLVGIGWAAANVAATALIADQVATVHRGRAIGINDSFAGAISVISALITGPLIVHYGLPGAGMAAIIFAVVPIILLLTGLSGRRASSSSTR